MNVDERERWINKMITKKGYVLEYFIEKFENDNYIWREILQFEN